MNYCKKQKIAKMMIGIFTILGLIISIIHYSPNLLFQSMNQKGNYPKEINIGYLRVPNDEMIAIEQDYIKKQFAPFGIQVNFLVFDSGVDANKALASANIDFASMGVTNSVVALSKALDVELIWVHELLGSNEALVVKENRDINTIEDLKGKVIATTFASTSHYSLKKALALHKMEHEVTLLDMKTIDIAAAWKRDDIDAAYTWDPILTNIAEDGGKALLNSKDLVPEGIVTANVMLGRKGFTHQYPDLTSMIIAGIIKGADFYRNHPNQAAEVVAESLEISPETALLQMSGTIWLTAVELLSTDYLGSNDTSGHFEQVIAEIGEFLQQEKEISKLPTKEEIAQFVNASYIEKAQEVVIP